MCQKVMAKLSGFKVDLKVIYIMPFKFNVGLLNAYKLTFAIERSMNKNSGYCIKNLCTS